MKKSPLLSILLWHLHLYLGLITIVGVIFTPWFLKLMGTPDDVFLDAVTYLRIYFAGGIGIVMYNSCMGIFQAVGDSKHPLYYLIIAAITNVVLDILFVAVFDFGVAGAALHSYLSLFKRNIRLC